MSITEQQLIELNKKYPNLVATYKVAGSSTALEIAKKFKGEMDQAGEKILNDDLYDKSQRATLIERLIEEKKDQYLSMIENELEERKETLDDLKEFLEEELEDLESKANRKFKKNEFELNDILDQTKTALALARDKESIVAVADKLLKQAEKNPLKAKVLMNSIHNFMERAKEVSKSDKDIFTTQASLEKVLNKAGSLIYSPNHNSLKRMLKNTEDMRVGGVGAKRIIKSVSDSYQSKANRLKQEHAYDRFVEIKNEADKYINAPTNHFQL